MAIALPPYAARWLASLPSMFKEQLPRHTPSEIQGSYSLMFNQTCDLGFNECTEKVPVSVITALLKTDFC